MKKSKAAEAPADPQTTAATIQATWPALHIDLVAIDDLIPYIRNPRQHSPEQIVQLAASMKEFGWVNPVLRDEDQTILACHGRILAARKLGWEQAPVMTARGWTESKKRAYTIADNKLALNASWDPELLSAEIDALAEDEFPISLLGFSDEDMARLADDLMGEKFTGAQQPPSDNAAAQTESRGNGRSGADPTKPDQVSLVIPMSVTDREVIFEAIGHAKRTYTLDHSGEALCRICRQYLMPPS